jgi:choline dehydrogenase
MSLCGTRCEAGANARAVRNYDARHDCNLNVVEMPDLSSMAVPQAKLMGGGSSINGGTALRSTRADSDE